MFCYFCKNPSPVYCRFVSIAVRYVSRIARNEDSFTVSYLINSCGFSPESALSVAKKVEFKTPSQPDLVVNFFKNHGFSNTQIRKLIAKKPQFLLADPEKTFLPKFEFFYSKGISSFDLSRILSSNPRVLRYNLDKRIIPNFNYFKDMTGCDDGMVLVAYKSFSSILERDFRSLVAPNIAVLRECGVPESNISWKLLKYPRIFSVNREKFKRSVLEIKKLSFNPLKFNFLAALHVLVLISEEAREKKFNLFKGLGWSEDEITSAFRKFPYCMLISEQKIKEVMNVYVSTIGSKTSYIADRPILLAYSLKRRIIPRCSVLQLLLSKGMIKKEIGLLEPLIFTEKRFLERFVTPYEDPELLKLYEEKLGLSK